MEIDGSIQGDLTKVSENVSQPKVFEFAKEIGMETLALMDKIREWKLPVRSHMAELAPEMVEQIKTKLSETPSARGDAKKKKVVKKAAPTAATAAPGVAAKPAAKKPAAKAVAKPASRKIQGPANGPSAPEEAAAAPGKVVVRAAPKTVVRRKSDEVEELDAAESAVSAEEVDAPSVQVEEPAAQPLAAAVESEAVEPVRVTAAVEPVPASIAASVVTETMHASAPAELPEVEAPAAAAAPPEIPAGPVPGRKREIVMTGSGGLSGIRSEPRRNIVGRMDLSRVQPPPGVGVRPSGGMGTRPGGGAGVGGGSAGPRGLRAGFVSAAPVDAPGPDSPDRNRFEAHNRKRPGVGGPAATGKEKEVVVASFTATEFRKREMVFQPKKKKGMLSRSGKQTQLTTPRASKRVVRVNETMKVGDLAEALGVKAAQVVKKLMQNGVSATMNSSLDFDTVSLIAPEFGHEAVNMHRTVDQLIGATAFGELKADRIVRSPVVTVMGHVDHGKTSLLDAIRKADVASGEAGGITQHIGAYRVTTDDGHVITFLDTPGHEAFTAMRARGANVTDIAVIVVAADDGVMPQTAEAINHAKAAEVPIIVAINKSDKPGANPERIKQQLTEFQLVPEEWGGDTMFVATSATQKTGIKELLEQIYLLAEVEELTSNPLRSATGVVIEARVDKGRGPVATLLVKDGTLRVGQPIVVGAVAGRVRSLINDKGERVQEAGPSMPVEVLGLSETPSAGDQFDACDTEKDAAQIAAARKTVRDAPAAASTTPASKMTLEEIFGKVKVGEVKELAMVLKSDVSGSAEAIKGMLDKVATSEVKIKIIHSAVGGINESDVLLASAGNGIVVGFNVRPDGGAQAMAKREGVEIKTYTIVYEMMDDLKKAMSGLLAPEIKEQSQGRAEVRNVFVVPKAGTVAGCAVVDGKIMRNSQVRLVRDGKIVYTGKLSSLRRFKDDAKEVASGYECGIGIENFNDVKVGDVIEAFTQESISRAI